MATAATVAIAGIQTASAEPNHHSKDVCNKVLLPKQCGPPLPPPT